ncbi:MAG: ATP-binding cassette domain-containing protein [Gemmatimonadota bacterium]|nr:ATP-binding cassette domain-containing protein [Gemmatimonadota bacterium]MDQ8147292.1 ATP-binding cassette domain-containing protein [Gemmatimonadota bacterium]MDQ8149104.1 ATP-binding cassette domain-containing protein [Gemmatimonadota bacterium]MDQ8156310.1 ATP-binding cassette domain-containing protein [Gemmatimonadota bacterium]MDQ8176652.1 ATP-binding cassette domain-containing protein [Gemmatimonadota bacterium]
MFTTQITHILDRLAEHAGLSIDAAARRDAVRRLGRTAGTVEASTDLLVDAARRVQLAVLRRSVRPVELAEALRDLEGPIALVAPTTAGDIVFAIVEPGEAGPVVRRVGPDGIASPEAAAPEAFLRSLGGPDALAAMVIPVPTSVTASPASAERRPVDRLLELLLLEKGNIILVYAYATLVGLLSLTLPLGVQAIIGLVSGGLFLQPVVLLIGFVVLGTLATGVLQVFQLRAVERIQQRIFARIALEFAIRIPRVSTEAAWATDLPERMNRFFEVVTIQKSLGKLLTGTTTALLQVIFGLLLLTFYHPYFTLFGLGLVGLLWLILRLTGPRGLETSQMESAYKYRTAHWLEEVARSVVAFKAAGRATPALERMDGQVAGYLHYRERHFRVLVIQAMAAIGFKTLVTGALLILGSLLVIDRQITLGQFVAAELVIVTVLAGIEKLVGSLAEVYDVLTSVDKLGAVTDLPLESTQGLPLPAGETGASLEVEGLSYSYPDADRPALSNIAFRLAPGARVAITGPDGSGETTLLAALAGLLEGTEGTVLLDDLTLRDLEPASIRDRVGLVLGGAGLFEGTLEDNISLGRSGIDAAAVVAALDRVGAHAQVQRLPAGLRTLVENGGRGLPSTLRVRLLLARAIVTRPRLLLIDECLSTVEPSARQELIDVLTAADAPWTLLVVSHTRDLLAACDRVLVLRAGAVVADAPWAVVMRLPEVAALLPSARSAG